MPLAVAHLDFILLFTTIFIIAYLFYAYIYVSGHYIYDRLNHEHRWTVNEDEGVTTSHEGFNHRRTLHDGPVDTTPFRIKDNTSRIPRVLRGSLLRSRMTQTQRRLVLSLILPFGCFQHVIKQGRGGSLLNTQNVGIKTSSRES